MEVDLLEQENYGFVSVDVEIAEHNITDVMRYENGDFVVASPVDSFSELLTNSMQEERDVEEIKSLVFSIQQSLQCSYLLLVWKAQDEIHMVCSSLSPRTRAGEFLDFLISEFGLIRGNASCATGRVSATIMDVQIANAEEKTLMDYVRKMVQLYHEDCDWIEASQYGEIYKEQIQSYPLYQKKKIGWAYVKTEDICESGNTIRIKSLENASGISIDVDAQTYIMIGCRGEVYDITKEKFDRTYEPTDEMLDVFEQMLDFMPEAQIEKDGSYVSLDELAHVCYPQSGNGIYATKITKRTKIFSEGGKGEYYLGRAGDYMAIRADDFKDIYIIQGEIFLQTYEAVEEE